MKHRTTILPLFLAVGVLLSSCVTAGPIATPTDLLDSIRTAAAQTVEAMTTEIVTTAQAADTLQAPTQPEPTPLTPPEPDFPTPLPPATPTQPTNPAASATIDPALPCDLAGFASETLPDGTQLPPGTVFTKTWTLKNEGSCTWDDKYSVVFVQGEKMNASSPQALTLNAVAPGQSVTVSLQLTAPATAGDYRAEFKLRNAAGVIFAFRNPDATFWADIEVVGGAIDLAALYCTATWTSAIGTLPCPGQPTSMNGYVYSDNTPTLENGTVDDETALWLGVQTANNGYLRGTYPIMLIPSGARFTAVLGCAHDQEDCDVKFSLNYQAAGGSMQTLATWNEVNDGKFQRIDIDLSAIAGKSVAIILQLEANGAPDGDRVHLLAPRIK